MLTIRSRAALALITCAALPLTLGAGPEATDDEASNFIDPSALPAEQAFDFYIGRWEYSFPQGSGRAVVTKKHDRVICAEVEGKVGEATFTGSSMAAYAADINQWRQSWTDTFGFFLFIDCHTEEGAFIGEWNMMTAGGMADFRHVFSNITEDSFTTDLYFSSDEGETWQNIRHAIYTRVK